jgi:hypothetical protein
MRISVFPAVGLLGRLVMAPEGLVSTRIVDHPRDFLWCPKPLDLGGLALVNFTDKTSIRKAVLQAGNRAKDEIRKICARYMHKRGIPKPNFDEIAEILGVNRRYFDVNAAALAFSDTSVSVTVESGDCVVGRKSRVVLQVHNRTDCDFEWVRVRVRAPLISLPVPVTATVGLPKAEPVFVEFFLTPHVAPFCPLEVACELADTKEEVQPFPKAVILNVALS